MRRPRSTIYRRALLKAKAKRRVAKRYARNRRVATVGMVKKLLHKNIETKYAGYHIDAVSFNNRITAPGDVYPICPLLVKGIGNGNRLGNKVTPRGLKVTVTVGVNNINSTPGLEILPRLLVLEMKSNKDETYIPAVLDDTILLDDGTGERAFAGDMLDYMAPINKEYLTVHKDIKTRICLGTVEQNLGRTRTFTFWVKCPKVLNYNDNTQQPNNFAPFFCAAFACGDFSVPSDGFLAMKISLSSILYYEDA